MAEPQSSGPEAGNQRPVDRVLCLLFLERKGLLVFEMFLTTVLYAGHELINFLSQPPKHTISIK